MFNHAIEAKALKKAVDESRSIAVIAHQSPDGDTVGANLAWVHYATSLGKTVVAFCADPIPKSSAFLPSAHSFTNDPNHLLLGGFDLVIANDVAVPERLGISLEALRTTGALVVNIDHHITNPSFGDINIIIPSACSTTEILARLFHHWKVPLTAELSTVLLNGIVTDTDAMTNPGTSQTSFALASTLVKNGGDLFEIVSRAFKNKSIGSLQLWGRALSRLIHLPNYHIAATYLNERDLAECGAQDDAEEGIANYLMLLSDAAAILVLKERNEGFIKGSFRTMRDDIDVSELAGLFGGGGHKKAAGFRLRGSIHAEENRWTII